MGAPLPDSDLHAELTGVAQALADAARAAILPHFRTTSLEIDNKHAQGFDPVTAADRAAERAMRDILAERRPQDAILGEEFGRSAGESGLTWVLDPIDGTRGFMSGTPTWGVLIALCDASGPILGVIDQPYIGERFLGGFGQALWNGPRGGGSLRARTGAALEAAVLMSTFPEVGTPEERAAFERVASRARLTRYGCDCYAYALLAMGQVDLVIEAGLQAYDICAPIAVIEAAGGIVTDWQGQTVHEGGQVLAAATPELHAAALTHLRG
ncbi:histidinol-phosphatase [Litorisediminicola beolgyonensis]|uniref:Histidinol-phosphatase n=1 Tax=Litorisediminicola beolgyonensis TaxID=1173614 RepID=A0ABW3ZHJ0_9RHOB